MITVLKQETNCTVTVPLPRHIFKAKKMVVKPQEQIIIIYYNPQIKKKEFAEVAY